MRFYIENCKSKKRIYCAHKKLQKSTANIHGLALFKHICKEAVIITHICQKLIWTTGFPIDSSDSFKTKNYCAISLQQPNILIHNGICVQSISLLLVTNDVKHYLITAQCNYFYGKHQKN